MCRARTSKWSTPARSTRNLSALGRRSPGPRTLGFHESGRTRRHVRSTRAAVRFSCGASPARRSPVPDLPEEQPVEQPRRPAAGLAQLPDARQLHRRRGANVGRFRLGTARRSDQGHSVQRRRTRATQAARHVRSPMGKRSRPLSDSEGRADRGRRRRPCPGHRPRSVPPLRAVPPPPDSQGLARLLRRDLELALEPAPPAPQNLRGRSRPADLSRPRPLRRGSEGTDRPRPPLHRQADAWRLHLSGPPPRQGLRGSVASEDGHALAPACGLPGRQLSTPGRE